MVATVAVSVVPFSTGYHLVDGLHFRPGDSEYAFVSEYVYSMLTEATDAPDVALTFPSEAVHIEPVTESVPPDVCVLPQEVFDAVFPDSDGIEAASAFLFAGEYHESFRRGMGIPLSDETYSF